MTTDITILDGGMGQELVKRSPGELTSIWGVQVLIDYPDLVRTVHDEYFAAGAEIATANSYSLHRDRLIRTGYNDRFEELQVRAVQIARDARDAHGSGIVAGALGPLEQSYVGDDGPPREKSAALFDEIARLQAPYVDVFIAETVPSLARMRATLDGLEGHGMPIWLAISVQEEDGTLLRSGEPVEAVLPEIEGRDVGALLVNCSPPEAVTQALEVLSGAPYRLGAYANGFRPIPEEYKVPGTTVEMLSHREDLTPDVYADFAEDWARLGATIIGGCCEVGPAHIATLSRRLKPEQNPG